MTPEERLAAARARRAAKESAAAGAVDNAAPAPQGPTPSAVTAPGVGADDTGSPPADTAGPVAAPPPVSHLDRDATLRAMGDESGLGKLTTDQLIDAVASGRVVVPDLGPQLQAGKCSKCWREILWGTTTKGAAMPLDPQQHRGREARENEPAPITRTLFTPIDGRVRAKIIEDPEGDVVGYVTHWATCPEAQSFKPNTGRKR